MFPKVLLLSIQNKKNVINLNHLKDDFVMGTEWHFFAMSHYKDACNGIVKTTKKPSKSL
jgi:hypothetical protein